MRNILTTIVILAFVAQAAMADLTITVPDILVSDDEIGGSFEVYVTTDESNMIASHQTRLTIGPASSGITFDSIQATTDHPYVFPSSTLLGSISAGGSVLDVGDLWTGAAQSLGDGDGLFKVNYSITPGSPPYPVFDLTVSTNPAYTTLLDGGFNPLSHTVDNGEIQLQQNGPHRLQIKLNQTVGTEGVWVTETSTLVVSYGEIGATTGRSDTGVNGDVPIGWGTDKFNATAEGDFGIYTRGTPFGSGDDMLVQDARPLHDESNVLIETYTNQVFERPDGWVPGVTWNEGGVLEFEVLSNDKTFFDDFEIAKREPGRFLVSPWAPAGTDLKDLADWFDGKGTLEFGRVGCDWLGDREVDWLVGPFAAFDLIPPDGSPWPDGNAPLSIEPGTIAVAHEPTPEPSSIILLAAGLGVLSRRRKRRASR